jgi:hypothetical protein
VNAFDKPRFARRKMIKMIAAAAAAPALFRGCVAVPEEVGPPAGQPDRMAAYRGPAGTLTDPDLVNPNVPWPLTLTADERIALAALCDAIIPADEHSPAASAIAAHDFIDEWVSAPYPQMQDDGTQIRDGLAWLDGEARRRFQAPFADLAEAHKHAICDDICYLPEAAPEFEMGAHFFDKIRILTAMAFYTTRAGMDDIGYVGNTPQSEWLPPPPAVLRKVGLA